MASPWARIRSHPRLSIFLTIVVVSVCGYYLYSLQFGDLNDDQMLINAIGADPRVNYTHIQLGQISEQYRYHAPILFPEFEYLPNYWKRSFVAWQFPPDNTPPSENMKIFGLIDGDLNIAIIYRARGDYVPY